MGAQDGEYYRSKSVAAAAERVLAETLGGPVRLGKLHDVWVYPDESRRTIQRALVLEGPEGAPATVIVKRIHGEDPYDPEDLRSSGGSHGDATAAWRLLCEWAATDFLSRFRGEPPLCPHPYGGDMAEGFVILEDLGSGQRLRDLLLGNDPIPAEKALLGYATALGRIHGVSIGGEPEYDRFWDTRGSRHLSMRGREAGLIRENWRRIAEVGNSLNVSWPRGVDAAIETVVAAIHDPGPFLALTQGDNFPANDMVAKGRLRLYDFERAAFRHALFDGFVKPHLLPWRRHRFPVRLEQRFEAIYRQELMQGCPEAGDDVLYARGALEMRAAWMLRLIVWHLETALASDSHWEGDLTEAEKLTSPTVRQRTLMILEGFAEAAEQVGHLQTLGDAARTLAGGLRSLWQPAPCPLLLFPAFAAMGD